jgi:hypothetical protein
MHAVECTGDYLINCKNCTSSFYLENSENLHYSLGLLNYKDSHNVIGGIGPTELCYELMTISAGSNYNIRCSGEITESRNIEYSDLCRNSHDLFGCVGLANKSFCILNRQYAEQEYWQRVDMIKTAMLKAGEYGEFFPPSLTLVPYRLSIALSYGAGFDDFENAARYGYDTKDIPRSDIEDMGVVLSSKDLPAEIKDADDGLTKKTILDEMHSKHFRILPYELAFYRRHNIALPTEHPLERMRAQRSVYPLRLRFFARKCPRCSISFESVYNPKEYVNVLCERCYNAEVV